MNMGLLGLILLGVVWGMSLYLSYLYGRRNEARWWAGEWRKILRRKA